MTVFNIFYTYKKGSQGVLQIRLEKQFYGVQNEFKSHVSQTKNNVNNQS